MIGAAFPLGWAAQVLRRRGENAGALLQSLRATGTKSAPSRPQGAGNARPLSRMDSGVSVRSARKMREREVYATCRSCAMGVAGDDRSE